MYAQKTHVSHKSRFAVTVIAISEVCERTYTIINSNRARYLFDFAVYAQFASRITALKKNFFLNKKNSRCCEIFHLQVECRMAARTLNAIVVAFRARFG